MADPSDILKDLGTYVGIGVGTLELKLVKTAYAPGEWIMGRLYLRLEQDVEAEKLVVALRCTQSVTTRERRGPSSRETRALYEFEEVLDRERTYRRQEYDVKLRVPDDLPDAQPRIDAPDGLGSLLSTALSAAELLQGRQRAAPVWRVSACLHVPWKRNVRDSVDVDVH